MSKQSDWVTAPVPRETAVKVVEDLRTRLKDVADDVAAFWLGVEDGAVESVLDLTCESLWAALDGLGLAARTIKAKSATRN